MFAGKPVATRQPDSFQAASDSRRSDPVMEEEELLPAPARRRVGILFKALKKNTHRIVERLQATASKTEERTQGFL